MYMWGKRSQVYKQGGVGALSSTSFVSFYTVRRSKVNHNCLLIDTSKRLTVGPVGAARHQASWLESCLESQNGILIPAIVKSC